MSEQFFYRAEVKSIQAWILASDRLKELKGGSAIVDGLAADAQKLLARLGVDTRDVIAAAGSVQVLFDEQAALHRFAAAWPLVVAQRAPGLTLVQAWGPRSDMDGVFARLGAQRNRQAPTLPEAGPLMARSGRTSLPAVRRGQKDGLEDRIVAAKLGASGEQGLDRLAPDGYQFEVEADHLSDDYIAVIHADGNNVGQHIMTLHFDMRKKANFSRALSEATENAARTAVEKLVAWTRHDNEKKPDHGHETQTLRARPIVLGGDDFTFLVDARYGLPFAIAFLEAFEQETSARPAINGDEGLTACAGIAFVKTSFPFHAGHALAEDLCGAAKKELRRKGAPTPSGLLFHRVTTASTDTRWEHLTAGELRAGDGLLAGGPYDMQRLNHLSALATAAAGLPRGSLRQWLTLKRQGSNRAQAFWQRTQEVAHEQRWAVFAEALRALGHKPDTGLEPLADTDEPTSPRWRSAIGDALLWRTLQPDIQDRTRREH